MKLHREEMGPVVPNLPVCPARSWHMSEIVLQPPDHTSATPEGFQVTLVDDR